MAEINEHAINNEQYSRKSSIRYFGIPASEGEQTESKGVNFFRSVLKVDIKAEDIHIFH